MTNNSSAQKTADAARKMLNESGHSFILCVISEAENGDTNGFSSFKGSRDTLLRYNDHIADEISNDKNAAKIMLKNALREVLAECGINLTPPTDHVSAALDAEKEQGE